MNTIVVLFLIQPVRGLGISVKKTNRRKGFLLYWRNTGVGWNWMLDGCTCYTHEWKLSTLNIYSYVHHWSQTRLWLYCEVLYSFDKSVCSFMFFYPLSSLKTQINVRSDWILPLRPARSAIHSLFSVKHTWPSSSGLWVDSVQEILTPVALFIHREILGPQ